MNSVSDLAGNPSRGGLRLLLWIFAFAGALLLAWFVMMNVVPAPTALASWTYPGAREISPSNALPFECRSFTTPNEFDAVNRWYSARASTGNGDPAFIMRGEPFGGALLGLKVSLASNQFMRATLHCLRTPRELTAALVSHARGEPMVRVTVFAVREQFSPPNPAALSTPVLNALAFPGAKRGSGGSAGTSSGFQFTSTDPVDKIFSHFLTHFGVAANAAFAPGSTLPSGATNAPNTLSCLPVPARPGVEERTLIVQTATNICLVHLARGTDAPATEMVVLVVPR